MKKHFTWIVTFIGTISLVFFFMGCRLISGPNQSTTNEKSENGIVAGLNPIGFKVSLPTNQKNRAIYYTQEDASSYVVKLSKGETVISTQTGTPGQTLTFTVEQEGTYTINVSAYNTDNTLIAEGSSSKSITLADGYVSVVITLRPKEKDPSSVTNKVDIGIDIQWVQPESKVLTLTAGNSYFKRWDSGLIIGNTVALEFTSGMTLYDIFRANDVDFWLDSYEKNGRKYSFASYYLDADGNEYYEYSMLTEDVTLSPVFEMVPQVTFNLNGGNFNDDTSNQVYFTSSFGKYNPFQPTKAGLVFVGWTLTPDGEDFVNETEEDITVYAKYIEVQTCTLTVTTNEHSYFYSYDVGGSVGTSITLEFTSGMTLEEIFSYNQIEQSPNPYNYEVNGEVYSFDCYQDASLNKYEYNSVLLENLELTAVYKREPLITFNLNGGNINGDISDVITNYNVLYYIPTKEGYVLKVFTQTLDGEDFVWTFDGYVDSNFLVEKYELGEDITLYAKWTEPETCTLTLQAPENSYFTSISTGENLGSSLTLEFTNGITLGEIFAINDVNFSPESYFDSEGYFYEFNGTYMEDLYYTYYEYSVLLYSIKLTPGYNNVAYDYGLFKYSNYDYFITEWSCWDNCGALTANYEIGSDGGLRLSPAPRFGSSCINQTYFGVGLASTYDKSIDGNDFTQVQFKIRGTIPAEAMSFYAVSQQDMFAYLGNQIGTDANGIPIISPLSDESVYIGAENYNADTWTTVTYTIEGDKSDLSSAFTISVADGIPSDSWVEIKEIDWLDAYGNSVIPELIYY